MSSLDGAAAGPVAGEVPVAGVVVACDVGGTGIKAGLVDVAGQVHHPRSVPTPVVDGDGDATAKAVLDRVAGLVTVTSAGRRSGAGAYAARMRPSWRGSWACTYSSPFPIGSVRRLP